MTLAEFKAWFEGFTETLEAAPNEKQWARIKARVAEIDGAVTTYPVFVDRYIPPYRRWYDGVWLSGPIVGCGSSLDGVGSISYNSGTEVGVLPATAMADLGKAEFRSLYS